MRRWHGGKVGWLPRYMHRLHVYLPTPSLVWTSLTAWQLFSRFLLFLGLEWHDSRIRRWSPTAVTTVTWRPFLKIVLLCRLWGLLLFFSLLFSCLLINQVGSCGVWHNWLPDPKMWSFSVSSISHILQLQKYIGKHSWPDIHIAKHLHNHARSHKKDRVITCHQSRIKVSKHTHTHTCMHTHLNYSLFQLRSLKDSC